MASTSYLGLNRLFPARRPLEPPADSGRVNPIRANEPRQLREARAIRPTSYGSSVNGGGSAAHVDRGTYEQPFAADDPYGLNEQPVEVYEPDYSYDDYDRAYSSNYDEAFDDARQYDQGDSAPSYDTAPIGSGLGSPASTRYRGAAVPKSLPRRRSTISGRLADDDFIEKLLPVSQAPRPGFLQPTPPR